MADPNPDRMVDDEDLEDGEIETDEENDTGGGGGGAGAAAPVPAKPVPAQISEPSRKEDGKKTKAPDDDVKKPTAKQQKNKAKDADKGEWPLLDGPMLA